MTEHDTESVAAAAVAATDAPFTEAIVVRGYN